MSDKYSIQERQDVTIAEEKSPHEEAATATAIAPVLPMSPNDAPNGGLKAWLQVLGSFLLFMNGWGIVVSFGAYQAFYEGALLSHKSSSDISWIGTTQAFLLIILGVFAGPLFDLGYMRTLLWLGTFLIVFGMMMTSICTQYWSLFLAQGLCVGTGAGCTFLPAVSVVATYFTSKRALALGICAVGSSFGEWKRFTVSWYTTGHAYSYQAGLSTRSYSDNCNPKLDLAGRVELPVFWPLQRNWSLLQSFEPA